jgi:hypothetical protein
MYPILKNSSITRYQSFTLTPLVSRNTWLDAPRGVPTFKGSFAIIVLLHHTNLPGVGVQLLDHSFSVEIYLFHIVVALARKARSQA